VRVRRDVRVGDGRARERGGGLADARPRHGRRASRRVAFAHCAWTHADAEGAIVAQAEGLEVYGNVFVRPPGSAIVATNGVVGTWTGDTLTDARIYNNTFDDLGDVDALGLVHALATATNVVANNVFYRTRVEFGDVADHDQNDFCDVPAPPVEPSGTIAAGDPVVDAAAGNFAPRARPRRADASSARRTTATRLGAFAAPTACGTAARTSSVRTPAVTRAPRRARRGPYGANATA
jgi:hypothetical protein